MSATRAMTAVDAQMFWMSATIPNDQFVLYAFDGSPGDLDSAVDELRRRARRVTSCDCGWSTTAGGGTRAGSPGEVGADQFAVHHEGGVDWQGCLDAAARLRGDQLDLRRMTWRAHIFPQVLGIPGCSGRGLGGGGADGPCVRRRQPGDRTGRCAAGPSRAGAGARCGPARIPAGARSGRRPGASHAGARHRGRAGAAARPRVPGAQHQPAAPRYAGGADTGAAPRSACESHRDDRSAGRDLRGAWRAISPGAARTRQRSAPKSRWPDQQDPGCPQQLSQCRYSACILRSAAPSGLS